MSGFTLSGFECPNPHCLCTDHQEVGRYEDSDGHVTHLKGKCERCGAVGLHKLVF